MVSQAIRDAAKIIEKFDPEWYLKIDPANLDMESCANCVLAQVFYPNEYFGGEWSEWNDRIYSEAERLGTYIVPGIFASNYEDIDGVNFHFRDDWIGLAKEMCGSR